ncbi:MAG: tRNA epoxyqueuosine(34) reductase QueG [Phycisphaerae bacterium]
MSPAEKTALVRELALGAGFVRVGVAKAEPLRRAGYLREWLAQGCAGSMNYLARWQDLRADPRLLLAGARSIIVVAWQDEALADGRVRPGASGSGRRGEFDAGLPSLDVAQADDGPRGRVARYAWGPDYHQVVRKRLRRLADRLREVMGEPLRTRVCVDTAPIIEREWAAVAGIGWIGRNTMVIDPQIGSMFMLGEIITTAELEPTTPAEDRCGNCMRCVEACPTAALIRPYQMDASRCISYLTIEHRGEISEELSRRMGNWVFGCDVCQEVCPWNRHSAVRAAKAVNEGNPLLPSPLLSDVFKLNADQYDRFVRGSAMKRATLEMLRRNARIALGNCHGNRKGDGTAE